MEDLNLRELLVRESEQVEWKENVEPWDRRIHPEARVADIDLIVLRNTLQQMGVWDENRPIDDYLRSDHRIFALSDPLCSRESLTNVVRPRNYALLYPSQMPGATVALRQALAVIGQQHRGIPLHIIMSAPVALAIELGRQLTAAVFPSAIIHHLDVASAAYVPVLDVVQRKIVSPDLTA